MRNWEVDVLGGAEAIKMIRFAAYAADGLMLRGDKPRRPLKARKAELLACALAATLVLAASSYWVGMQSVRGWPDADEAAQMTDRSAGQSGAAQPPRPESGPTSPSVSATTIAVPKLASSAPAEARTEAPAQQQLDKREAGMPPKTERPAAIEKAGEAMAEAKPLTAPTVKGDVKGNSGQMVRIGRFASPKDAERGWASVLRQWPGMQTLPAAPVSIRSLRDGRTYYRLQVGTTSRAHSEVVCERVHDLDQSCTIIGSDEESTESTI